MTRRCRDRLRIHIAEIATSAIPTMVGIARRTKRPSTKYDIVITPVYVSTTRTHFYLGPFNRVCTRLISRGKLRLGIIQHLESVSSDSLLLNLSD